MKKWLLGMALLVSASAAVIYLQRLSEVNDQLARIAASLSDYGRLSWDSVLIDPRGRAIVRRVEFQPSGELDLIRADSLVLIDGNLAGLAPLEPARLESSQIGQWAFELRGLRLPIGPLVSSWRLEPLGLIVPFRSRGCDISNGSDGPSDPGHFDGITLGDLVALGYGRLELDLELDIEQRGNRTALELRAEVDNLGETRQHWELQDLVVPDTARSAAEFLGAGLLRQVDYRIRDRGLLSRLDPYCHPTPAEDRAEFNNARFQSWLRAWSDLGLEPSGIAQAAFQHYLENPDESVAFRARPERALPLADLDESLDRNLIQEMRPSFALDDGHFLPLALNEVPVTAVVAPPRASSDEAPTTQILRSESNVESTIVVGRPPAWRRIERASLEEHIGDLLRIDFIDGTQLTGRLAGLGEGQIDLQTQNRMGEFIRPIALDDVAAIEARP